MFVRGRKVTRDIPFQKLNKIMKSISSITSFGKEQSKIGVLLSYKLVQLFSEGLYTTPNKAIEELVANSFDAGALQVAVLLPADFNQQGATIVVMDDGESMNAEGLAKHWLIGKSFKRELAALPKGRQQIGKFGIGKLATYVLANRLTHLTRKDGKYFSTTMDYKVVDERGEEEIEPKKPIEISLRTMSENEAKEALKPWTDTAAFKGTGFKLFGSKASKSWTIAILSELKVKVHELQRGRLEWVLSTALPLRPDFAIFVNEKKLTPSKAGKGKLKTWKLGKELSELPTPAPSDLEVNEDTDKPVTDDRRYGFLDKSIGRITGFAEAYQNLLTGKSDQIGRSNGFFVYVLDRLINVEDGHFGISPDELRHGTFGRMRVVVHMDGLDKFLQSDRERIRHGPALEAAQNILRGIFNSVRTYLASADVGEEASAKFGQSLAGSQTSVSRRPIVAIARAALEGKYKPRYVAVPPSTTQAERDTVIANLEARIETPETFVTSVELVWDATADFGLAIYDARSGVLRVNGFHPFVASFFDEFESKSSGLPLKLFAMAEVLLEAQLYQQGYKQSDVNAIMGSRDRYLRDVADSSGRRTALTISLALHEARNNESKLEDELVAAFNSLGFDATKDARKGKADGIAKAHLSADAKGLSRQYSVTLEAKSTQSDGKRVATQTVNVATIALHRDEYKSEHAIVVGPAFASDLGVASNLAKQLAEDRKPKADGSTKTITVITIDDLARLVRLAPAKGLGLSKLRDLFITCSLPEDCKYWIDEVEKIKSQRPPYRKIVEAIQTLQQKRQRQMVKYSALLESLSHLEPPVNYETEEELMVLCKAMAQMAAGYLSASDESVELDQSPENVVNAIESAMKAHLADKH
jgi:hypothetical protein